MSSATYSEVLKGYKFGSHVLRNCDKTINTEEVEAGEFNTVPSGLIRCLQMLASNTCALYILPMLFFHRILIHTKETEWGEHYIAHKTLWTGGVYFEVSVD